MTGRSDELASLAGAVRAELSAVHEAREVGLPACRKVIRACGLSIRAVHRGQPDQGAALLDEAAQALREAQQVLAPHPSVAFAGFLHDAEKEYAEAWLTAALIEGAPLAGHQEIGVQPAAWLNGLAEAASELRRALLDRLRAGRLDEGEALLGAMDEVYDVLVTIDYPDAITGGLRRTTDAFRAVLERTRSDLTLTLVQSRLHRALEDRTES